MSERFVLEKFRKWEREVGKEPAKGWPELCDRAIVKDVIIGKIMKGKDGTTYLCSPYGDWSEEFDD